MNTTTYTTNPLAGLISHWGQLPSISLDGTEVDHHALLAQVIAGAYFSELAASLTKVHDNLPEHDAANRQALMKAINELYYLQKRYDII